jgi:hypothetical protein
MVFSVDVAGNAVRRVVSRPKRSRSPTSSSATPAPTGPLTSGSTTPTPGAARWTPTSSVRWSWCQCSRHGAAAAATVFVGSGGGLWPVPYDTGYAVTKAGLIRFRNRCPRSRGVQRRCFCIHPGVVHRHVGLGHEQPGRPEMAAKVRPGPERGKLPSRRPAATSSSGQADGLTGCFKASTTTTASWPPRQADSRARPHKLGFNSRRACAAEAFQQQWLRAGVAALPPSASVVSRLSFPSRLRTNVVAANKRSSARAHAGQQRSYLEPIAPACARGALSTPRPLRPVRDAAEVDFE